MAMTLGVFVVAGGLIVGIFITGCGGDDTEDSPALTIKMEPEPTFGVDGDTYWKREVWADGEEEWVKPDPVFFQSKA